MDLLVVREQSRNLFSIMRLRSQARIGSDVRKCDRDPGIEVAAERSAVTMRGE
ncbi:MAG TPA: hypothetical protein VLM89_04805 [Phycisphaerae bacterium]|nr:hypothetical protein [Phycisphaerae bacterium]